jgi:hypothetical protein
LKYPSSDAADGHDCKWKTVYNAQAGLISSRWNFSFISFISLDDSCGLADENETSEIPLVENIDQRNCEAVSSTQPFSC